MAGAAAGHAELHRDRRAALVGDLKHEREKMWGWEENHRPRFELVRPRGVVRVHMNPRSIVEMWRCLGGRSAPQFSARGWEQEGGPRVRAGSPIQLVCETC